MESSSVAEPPSIAVLPFENLSSEEDRYFTDGVTEDILTALSRFGSLLVIARHSSFAYRDRSDVLVEQIGGNPHLVSRLEAAKPIVVDVVPKGTPLRSLKLPKQMSSNTLGLFWDHRDWESARIVFREEGLISDPTLVFHEMGHAVHYLAFTKQERELVYRQLRPTFGSCSAMDEAFAIYSEQALHGGFTEGSERTRGVYGFTRR